MILVAIGANLPGPGGAAPIMAARASVAALADLPGLRLAGVSRWYRTAPVPPSGQADYVNGVARLEGEAGPEWLLARLLAIEALAGRRRGEANAARVLDLDLIAIGDMVRDAPDPILPHPRAHLRAFVLAPLIEVAPDWLHPVLRQTGAEMLARLPRDGIAVMQHRA